MEIIENESNEKSSSNEETMNSKVNSKNNESKIYEKCKSHVERSFVQSIKVWNLGGKPTQWYNKDIKMKSEKSKWIQSQWKMKMESNYMEINNCVKIIKEKLACLLLIWTLLLFPIKSIKEIMLSSQQEAKMLGIIAMFISSFLVSRVIVIHIKHIKRRKDQVNEFDQSMKAEEL